MKKLTFSFVFLVLVFLSNYTAYADYSKPDMIVITHVQSKDGTWLTINDVRFNGCSLTLTSDNGVIVYEDKNVFGTIPCDYNRYMIYSNDYPNDNYSATILRKGGYIDNQKVWVHIRYAFHTYVPIVIK